MKSKTLLFFSLFSVQLLIAQQKENDYLKLNVTGTVTESNLVRDFITLTNNQDNEGLFRKFAEIINSATFNTQSPDITKLFRNYLSNTDFINIQANGAH